MKPLPSDADALHAHLDAHPDDCDARLVLADALRERGDPDAADCFAWLARSGRMADYAPLFEDTGAPFRWSDAGVILRARMPPDALPECLFKRLVRTHNLAYCCAYYPTRRLAEEAAVIAWKQLPELERERLLANAGREEV